VIFPKSTKGRRRRFDLDRQHIAAGVSGASLDQSYQFCETIARTRAQNFYYSFLLLSQPQRQAMCAIYAFMRYCDDLSDGDLGADRRTLIAQWQQDLSAALVGKLPNHPLWPAFHDSVRRFQIPHQYFHEMIEGVSSDLQPRRIRTFDELYDYCYHVASVVGLVIIHIFGFTGEQALPLAEKCGVAFQLTNILRDVGEDAAMNRIYLPEEDRERFGVTEIRDGHEFRALLRFEGQRAQAFYDEARPLLGLIHRRSRPSLWALIEIYERLLKRMAQAGYPVLERRIALSTAEKVWILVRAQSQRWS
jgi:phytoene synthase